MGIRLEDDFMRFIIFVLAIFITYSILNHFIFKKKQINSTIKTWIVVFILLVFLGIDSLGTKIYGHQIGNYFETTGYTADYYVNFYNNEKNTKNYKLKSSITRDEETGVYILLSANWRNGGKLTFENNGYDTPLILNQKVEIYDDNDKRWFVELTNVKAK